MAHRSARDLTLRDATYSGRDHPRENRDPPSTYNEVTKHFYLDRRIYSTPHNKLTRPQAITFRMLQTNTYPTQNRLHHYMPELYTTSYCENCLRTLDVHHLLWPCGRTHANKNQDSARLQEALRSTDLAEQLWAVQRAHDAARELKLPVPTWE